MKLVDKLNFTTVENVEYNIGILNSHQIKDAFDNEDNVNILINQISIL